MILLADGNRKYPHSKLLASSADRGWSSIYAELRTHPAGRLASTLQSSVEIVIALRDSRDGVVTRTSAGRRERTRPTTGTIWLVPAGICHEEIELSTPMGETLHLYLPTRQFDLLAHQYDLPKLLAHSVQYLGGLTDELIHQVGLSVLSEMTRETSTGRMFAESAALMLAAQLSHNYLDTDLALAEIALMVGFRAQAHFTDVFKRIVGKTPAKWRQAAKKPDEPLIGGRADKETSGLNACDDSLITNETFTRHANLLRAWPSDLTAITKSQERPGDIGRVLRVIDDELSDGQTWVMVSGPTAADIGLYFYLVRAQTTDADLRSYPNVRNWLSRLGAFFESDL